MNDKRSKKIIVLAVLLAAAVVAGLSFGSTRVSLADFFSGGTNTIIITKLRLPRVLGALLSGIALPTRGLLLQSVTGNDLTSPNVMGINAGAGFAVMLCLCFASGNSVILPFGAFFGALVATALVMSISYTASVHREKLTIILAGVSVGALFNSGISYLSQRYPDAVVSYIWFSNGGFSGVYLKDIALPAVIILSGARLAYSLASQLNLLILGDDMAHSLGVKVKTVRTISLVTASAVCAASVTYAGLLGFVGLIVPHMARKIAGHDLRIVMPVSWMCGRILIIMSDLVGRALFAPSEISAGIFLSAIGAPFFIYLLYTRRGKL